MDLNRIFNTSIYDSLMAAKSRAKFLEIINDEISNARRKHTRIPYYEIGAALDDILDDTSYANAAKFIYGKMTVINNL